MANYDAVIYDKKIKERFLEVVPETTYNKEIIFAKQAFDNSDFLQKCSQESIRQAIVNIALTGATLNPSLHQAYLVPRKGKCCLDISYRGLIKIATESGGISHIEARVVHEKDEFFYQYGMNPQLNHVVCADPNPGELTHAYAIAYLPNGYKTFEVITRKEIEKVKAVSAAKSGPWVEWFDEMSKKTVIKKLYKLLPQTDRMSTAVSVINEHEGIDFHGQDKAREVMQRFGFQKREELPPPVDVQTMIECPDDPEHLRQVDISECEVCKKHEGCPALTNPQ